MSVSGSKRPRACNACHAIKIKCELGSAGGSGPPCERCVRLEKECIITPPKRQKDRVAELEAQVQSLTQLLKSQEIKAATGAAATLPDAARPHEPIETIPSQPAPQKKRKLDDNLYSGIFVETSSRYVERIEADVLVSQDTQRHLLDIYLNEIVPAFPLCPITGDCDYETMRRSRPLLLQAIIYSASIGNVSTDIQDELSKIITNLFATEALADGKKSMELIQAICIVVQFYRAPRHHTHISAFHMVEIMTAMAEDLGTGGWAGSPALGQTLSEVNLSATDALRTWSACQLLSGAMAIYQRQPRPRKSDTDFAHGIFMLEYAYALPTDRLLCQYVRAEALCGEIATRSNYYTADVSEVSDPEAQLRMRTLQDKITDWKAQIPPGVWCMGLEFWDHILAMYLHEPVLHTSTNKQSFSAPFIAEKLSVTDFPRPIVRQEHLASIASLRTASHAIIDLYTALDTRAAMLMPAVQFAARVLYALYILVKIYVASTGDGNTLGAFVDTETLQIEPCIDKMEVSATMIGAVDDRCGQYRILQAVTRMREWLSTYNTRIFGQIVEPNLDENIVAVESSNSQAMGYEGIDWNKYIADGSTGLGFGFGMGLDELFPELPPNEFATDSFENFKFGPHLF